MLRLQYFFYLTGDPSQGNDAGQGGDQDMDDGIIVITLYGLCMTSCNLSDSLVLPAIAINSQHNSK